MKAKPQSKFRQLTNVKVNPSPYQDKQILEVSLDNKLITNEYKSDSLT